MISKDELISIGIIRRTHYKDLPEFVFVLRDGLFVPFRTERISELIGEEEQVGVIAYVDESTINTLATLEDGRMIPLHEDFITEIDEEARVLHVRLPFKI